MGLIQATMRHTVWPGILLCFLSITLSQAQIVSSPPGTMGTKAEATSPRSRGQTIYVPVYSHTYFSNARRRYLLAVTLSIRNTDLHRSVTITSVRYYNTEGTLLQEYVEQPLQLGPLASTDVFVEERDSRGGAGGTFLVEWQAAEAVNTPLVEAIMVGTAGTQGITFSSPGRVINPLP